MCIPGAHRSMDDKAAEHIYDIWFKNTDDPKGRAQTEKIHATRLSPIENQVSLHSFEARVSIVFASREIFFVYIA